MPATRREALDGAAATTAPGPASALVCASISGQGSYSVSLAIDWLVVTAPPSSPPSAPSSVEADAA